jgi:hypothetical protein
MSDQFQDLKREHGWWHNHFTLYPLLGLTPGQHLPDEGFVKKLGRFEVFCVPKICQIDTKSRSKHRIFVKCDCGKEVPFGRMGQHVKGRAHR